MVSVHHTTLMSITTATLDQSDENGQISFTFAHCLADLHCLTAEFLQQYASYDRIDAGEFLVWLGY